MEAIYPLLKHLPNNCNYVEPCAGNGAIVKYLNRFNHHCVGAWDIEPQAENIQCNDAMRPLSFETLEIFDYFITNPPWNRDILHPLIECLCNQKPTWLLFDADWMHTKQSFNYLRYLKKIVSVGRVKWIPNSTMTGKDNCCWYLFDKPSFGKIEFVGRC